MKISALAKRMLISILIINSAAVLIAAIYHRSLSFLPFLYGALIGSAAAGGKVFLLERAVSKSLSMDKKSAGGYVALQQILRLFITGIVLYVGAVSPGISIWGTAVGVLSFQIATYTVKFGKRDS